VLLGRFSRTFEILLDNWRSAVGLRVAGLVVATPPPLIKYVWSNTSEQTGHGSNTCSLLARTQITLPCNVW
jgi:hypothetical protein